MALNLLLRHTITLACVSLLSTLSLAQCPGVTTNFTVDQSFFCGTGPHTLNFTNTSTGTNPPGSFEWFENGTSFATTATAGAPVSQNVNGAGTYTYMLVYSDPSVPCTDTAYQTVTVVPTPNAGFTFAPNNQCAFQDVNFTNTSTGTFAGTTYNWDFGQGPNSTQENPSYAYNGANTYAVTLTVDNGPGCTSTATQNVTVIDAPDVNISGDDGDGNLVYCLFPGDSTTSETVTFSNATTNATTYEWDFGDGSPLFTTNSLAPFTHDYTSYGTFTVTMTATNPNGCQTTGTLTVVFEKFVSAAMTLNLTEYSGCAPHVLSTLVNLSQNANSYVWDFGDGTVITTTDSIPPAHAYTAAGNYTISLQAINSCNQANATISPIIIIDGPTANFAPSITNGCAPQNVSFTNSSTDAQPANNFTWDMGNGNTYTSTTTPPVQTYPTTGTYDIQLIAGNACGLDTATAQIFIDTIPTVDLVLNPITGCAPLVVDPTATLLSGINVNWAWYVDGAYAGNTPNDIANQTFGSLNPNDSTLHTIQVNVSNNCGNDFDLDSVYVHPPVIAGFTTIDTLCLGTSSAFTNTSTGTELTYQWDFGDGSPIVNDTNTTHTYASSGTYTVTLTTTGVCGIDVYTFDVTILDFPTADISPNPAVVCSGGDVNFTNLSTTLGTYSWTFGAGATPATSTSFDPGVVNYVGSGQSEVIFTINYAGCIDADTTYVTIEPIPIPDFTVTPINGCSPLDVVITNNTVDSPGTTYNWSYGNGSTSNAYTAVNQTYTANLNDTTYSISLVVSSTNGCTDSISQLVSVYSLPNATYTILDDTVCSNEAMLFANNSTNATSYLWDFGDGTTSNTISPAHTFTGIGSFDVSLVAYTANGCTDTTVQTIFIDSIPLAGFTNTTECFGNATSFTNTSTGNPTSFSWDFGDGSPLETATNPQHTYTSSGNYLVSLTATNALNCSNTVVQLVQVNDVPVADFIWSQTCQGQGMNFTDQSLNSPITWDWDFGDGNTDNVQNPVHIYADTGSYQVQLIVSGGSGCLDTITGTVYVDSIPQADFTFLEACTGDSLFFTNNSQVNPDNFLWDFGDGNSSNTTDAGHFYSTAGFYNVSLTATYSWSGCSNTITQSVQSFPRTAPAFTANTPCLGELTNFVDQTGGTPDQWEWDFGDGSPTETTQNPTHLYSTQGFYDITLITENNFGCSDTLIQQIEIYGLPAADFTYSPVCEGAITQFTDNSVDDVQWEWDFGDNGATSNQENPTHTFSSNGTFTTELVVFNSVGCSDTISYPITVYPNPTAGFSVDTACFGYLTSFTDASIDAVQWDYDFGDGTTDVNSDPTHIYPADGIYNVQQLVTNIYGCQDSITLPVLIHPQPVAGFENDTVCALDVVQFNDTTLGTPTTWNWDFGDGSPNSSAQNPSHTYSVGGLYDITLIAGNSAGCADTLVSTIEVYTNPVPGFIADTVCFLDVTTFTDLSTDSVPIVDWYYDFGDNINQSTQQNPTYIYQAPGIYTASLVVTNINGCTSDTTFDVHVNNIPVAEFTHDTVCWGSPTTFTDVSTGNVNAWVWDFGDGNMSNQGPVVQHTYANPGTYLAYMEVDGGVGCTDYMFHSITVLDVLTPLIGAQDTACINVPIQFQDLSVTSSGTITGWSWDFGDGNTSTQQNPLHTYASTGIYTVTLNVQTSTGCTNTGTYTVEVFAPPVPDFDFTIPCEGQPTIFTDLSTDTAGTIVAWDWTFGDGSPNESTQNPDHLYATAGTYPVTLYIESSNGCLASIVQDVIIYPSPTADFIFGLECGGEPIDLVSTSTGNLVSYEWIYNGNTFSTDSITSYVFPTTTDTHPVTLVVTTNLGCVDTITQNVTTLPVVFFDYGPLLTAGCPVLEVNFFENSVTSDGSQIVNWLWDMGDSTYSFSQFPTHFYEDSGSYNVNLQVITEDDCIYTDTLNYDIIVYPQPTAGFIYSPAEISINYPEVTFTNTSNGAMDVEWHFGDFEYSNDWEPVHNYTDTGYYEVEQIVYNSYGCSDTAYQNLYVTPDLLVYVPNTFTPNGSGINETFNISGYGFESYKLYIFNRWGTLIHTVTEAANGWNGTYQGAECQDGVYTWKLEVLDYNLNPKMFTGHITLLR